MNNMIRITCPQADIPKEKRIELIINQEFNKWINEPLLCELVSVFDSTIVLKPNMNSIECISLLKQFVEKHWDYRKKQKDATTKEGEAARWLLQSEEIIENNKELIIDCAKKLGLIGNDDSVLDQIEYILPLGGARMSNMRRTALAKQIIDKKRLSNIKVVALSGMRPLSESEMCGYIETYAPEARFEFEAISKGLELAFKCGGYTEDKKEYDNPNENYVIRKYSDMYAGNEIYSIAAPSSEPEKRRANSADCFKFFFDKFKIESGSQLLNCTSQIYCSYQQVRALFFAIEYGVVFDTIGFPFWLNNPDGNNDINQLSKPVNYLQEIKATIDAMFDFIFKYTKI